MAALMLAHKNAWDDWEVCAGVVVGGIKAPESSAQ